MFKFTSLNELNRVSSFILAGRWFKIWRQFVSRAILYFKGQMWAFSQNGLRTFVVEYMINIFKARLYLFVPFHSSEIHQLGRRINSIDCTWNRIYFTSMKLLLLPINFCFYYALSLHYRLDFSVLWWCDVFFIENE